MKRRRGSTHRAFGLERTTHDGASDVGEDPGTAAARDRVEVLLEQLARVNINVVIVGLPDAQRLAARDRARSAAIAAGRGALLDEATSAVRERTLRVFARTGFTGTWAATDMSIAVARAPDRVAAAAAFEEAATAAIVEDLVDAETLEILRATSEDLSGLTGVPSPGSLSGFGSPTSAIHGPFRVAIVLAFGVLLTTVGLAAASIVVVALGVVILVGLVLGRRRDPAT